MICSGSRTQHHETKESRMDTATLQRYWSLAGKCVAAAEAGATGFGADLRPGFWAVSTHLPTWSGNWYAAHEPGDGVAEALATYVEGVVGRGGSAVGWITEAALEEVRPVTERGHMTLAGTTPLMGRRGAPDRDDRRAYPGTVSRLTAPERIAPALVVMGKAFDVVPTMLERLLPSLLNHQGMSLHVARRDGNVESMCLSFRDSRDCYVWVMATDPERQRRGAGRAVLMQAMEEAVTEGVEGFVLLASSAGQPLYRSLGYETLQTAGFWVINP
jgi:hypothetical protein